MVIPGLAGTPCGIVVKPPNRKQEARLWLGFATHHLCVVGQVISSLESSFLGCERGVLNKVSLKVLFKSETPRLSTCARNPVELQLRVGVRVSSSLRISLTQMSSQLISSLLPKASQGSPFPFGPSLSKRTPSLAHGMSPLTTSGFLQYLGDIENFASPSKSPQPYHVSLCLEKQTLLPLLVMVSLGLSLGPGILTYPSALLGYLLRIHGYGFLEAVPSKA